MVKLISRSDNGYYSSDISITFRGKKVGKKGGNPKKEKHEKELGRTDGKFEISRSKSPYPQILVPLSPSYPLFRSHQSFIFCNVLFRV